MYNKIFRKILDSSIWLEPDSTRIVWLTLIAEMDEDGFCAFACPQNVANRAIVALDKAEQALKTLESPDPNSADPELEGRRIERVPGGWLVLNASKYRALATREKIREDNRIRAQTFRDRKRNASVTHRNEIVTPSNQSKAELKHISSNPAGLDDAVSEIFGYYLEKTGRNPKTYELTTARRKKAISRLKECLEKTGGDIEKAKALMKLAVDGLVASDWHMGRDPKTNGKRYCEWEEHLFGSFEKMERWWNAVPSQAIKPNGHGIEARA